MLRTAPRCAHRRGRSDGMNPVAQAGRSRRESCHRAVMTIRRKADLAVLAAHYGGGNGQRLAGAAPEFQLLGVTA